MKYEFITFNELADMAMLLSSVNENFKLDFTFDSEAKDEGFVPTGWYGIENTEEFGSMYYAVGFYGSGPAAMVEKNPARKDADVQFGLVSALYDMARFDGRAESGHPNEDRVCIRKCGRYSNTVREIADPDNADMCYALVRNTKGMEDFSIKLYSAQKDAEACMHSDMEYMVRRMIDKGEVKPNEIQCRNGMNPASRMTEFSVESPKRTIVWRILRVEKTEVYSGEKKEE